MFITDKPLKGMKILVAEDQALLALDMMLILSKAGAEVIGPAMSVDRAIELARGEDLSCAVLDVRLRNKFIFPAADVLTEKGVQVVFHTGEPNPEAIAREWPHAKVLMKPAPLLALIKAVVEACAESQSRRTRTVIDGRNNLKSDTGLTKREHELALD